MVDILYRAGYPYYRLQTGLYVMMWHSAILLDAGPQTPKITYFFTHGTYFRARLRLGLRG